MKTMLVLTPKSRNRKTGPIPVTSRPMSTCPTSCPFLPGGEFGGCYGSGRIAHHADTWSVVHDVESLTDGLGMSPRSARYLRDRVVGDIVNVDGTIDMDHIRVVSQAASNVGLIPFGYTHAWRSLTDAQIVEVKSLGYVLSASCETEADVAEAVSRGLDAAIASDLVEEGLTIGGKRVVTCPQMTPEGITCADCGLCAKPGRRAVIRFLIHGAGSAKARAAVRARVDAS
jgi:hypothetical protein